jgi:hypothetical protein
MICKDNTGLAGTVETILIRRADESDVERLVVFMLQFRQELYPMLDPQRIPQDLIHFKKNYLDATLSSVYIAEDKDRGFVCPARRAGGRSSETICTTVIQKTENCQFLI